MNVNDASALQDTLNRLRQRYTLNFYFPEGSTEHSSVRVDLSQEAKVRYMDAEIQSRQVFVADNTSAERAGPTVITRAHTATANTDSHPSPDPAAGEVAPRAGRSVAVNEDDDPVVNSISPDDQPAEGPSSSGSPQTVPAKPSTAPSAPSRSGWPRANQSQGPN
jgi:hypothetical protein